MLPLSYFKQTSQCSGSSVGADAGPEEDRRRMGKLSQAPERIWLPSANRSSLTICKLSFTPLLPTQAQASSTLGRVFLGQDQ